MLNVEKMPKEESYSIMKDWQDKCSKLEKLNFNAKAKINEGIFERGRYSKTASIAYNPIFDSLYGTIKTIPEELSVFTSIRQIT